MRRTSIRKAVAVATAGLAATLALTACDAGGASASNGNGGSSAAASSADPAGGASVNSADGSRTASGNGTHTSSKASPCRTSDLRITAQDQGEAHQGLGSILITFTNTGNSCRMYGFPGVDMKTNYGTQSVDRNPQEKGTAFILGAGKRATANVVYPFNNTGGSGVRSTALVVTPPNETHHVTVPVAVSLPASDTDQGKLEVTPVFEER